MMSSWWSSLVALAWRVWIRKGGEGAQNYLSDQLVCTRTFLFLYCDVKLDE